jgi:molybdenum cofactor synthesis domain-containing protein
MRPFGEVMSLEAARAIIDNTGRSIDRIETVSLPEAAGRVLARDVVASGDVPPFSRAGMDGYAVRAADTRGASRSSPRTLKLAGTLFTGQVATAPVSSGECLEISTGAPMPEGADAVIMVEETELEDGRVKMFAEVQPKQNVGRRGADIAAGHVVVSAGETINSSRLGALAAVGTSQVDVYAKPRVAIASTGNEIVEPGQPLSPGQIYDINRFTLSAVVAENGGAPIALPPTPDSLDALVASLEKSAAASEIVVFSGGSSVGERDLIRDAIAAKGRLLFHGLAVKPGKPTGLGLVNNTPVFAMPGYPASCLSNAHVLLVPLLRRIARLRPRVHSTVTLPLSQRMTSAAGRHQFLTVRIANGQAVPAFKASGDITSMSRADGYIEIPADEVIVEAGTPVDVVLF